MRKLILTFLLFFCAIAAQAQGQKFDHVWISKEKVRLKPAVIYANYGDNFYLTLRDNKRVFDYKLTFIDSKMQGGLVEYNFKPFNEDGKEVKGLLISIQTRSKHLPAILKVIVDEVEEVSFEILPL